MDNSNTAQAYNPFAGFFAANNSRYEVDLSRSSVQEVLVAYQEHKRKTHPNYSNLSLRNNLRIVECTSGHVLRPIEVTDIFYAAFSEWLTQRGVRYSSQESYFGQIRTALAWATRHQCPVSSTYDSFDIPDDEAFTIALTPDEISHIAHFDVDNLPCRPQLKRTLARVRDMFCLSCQLGQRHSDIVRITKENFNRNIFTCVQQKTGQKAVVDLDKFAMMPDWTYRTLEKYDYTAPYTNSINKLNEMIHRLLKYIGEEFNDTYKIERKVAGVIVTETLHKYELVASHTARRSFATYNAHRNIALADLMHATGHKSIGCFQKYIKFKD